MTFVVLARSLRNRIFGIAKVLLPRKLRLWVVQRQRMNRLQWPRTGSVDFGQLRRTEPISSIFGLERGTPIDRYYIEDFLKKQGHEIRGRVLEFGDATYSKRYGGDRVTRMDVLHVTEGNPEATIVADLADAGHIASDAFDCIVCTQSLQMIYDFKAALRTLFRILRPGGVLLLTSSAISKVGRRLGRDDWGEYWRLTSQAMEEVFAETFPGADIEIVSCGNVLAAVAALHGLAVEELSPEELNYRDPDFEVIVTVKARLPG